MKISGYYKERGAFVEFATDQEVYNKVYVSKIFTESKEPDYSKIKAFEWLFGGSGYDLDNKLPYEIEHSFPDYSLYPDLTQDTAFGMLTRGCPRCNHGFCITPKKDGKCSKKVADLTEFWNGQKNICLLDQNILACLDERVDLLHQLSDSGATVEFNGGMDARFITNEIIEILRTIKVKDYHFAWDDPKENLQSKFQIVKDSGLKDPNYVGVYVLTNYWSTTEEDLYRIYTLRSMGFVPFVMIYDKQRFVNQTGNWLPGVEKIFTEEQLLHFKICQHLQRWCNNRKIIKTCEDFNNYEWYKRWLDKGKPVPGRKV
jgi:hypothetical protein